MRFILLVGIRIYWMIPKIWRRECIFKESCSNYVYRITKRYGYKLGILALQKRYQKCRPGYYRITNQKVRLADNSIVSSILLNETIFKTKK